MRLLLLALLATGCAWAQPRTASPVLPPEVGQLVLVVTPAWDATGGTLQRYERAGEGWRRAGEPVEVVVGRSGLGWGRGLHGAGTPAGLEGPAKREGDGRAPAGAFALTETFGYADSAETGLPYVASTASVECVDDVASRYYNRVLRRDSVEVDWGSHEEMRRRDDLYRLGVVVAHNAEAEPGAGSCIFLHVWRGPDSTTSGCTAMRSEAVEAMAAWLDAGKRPVLVQVPDTVYAALRHEWGLP